MNKSYTHIHHVIYVIYICVCIYDNMTHTHAHIVVIEARSHYIPQGLNPLYFSEFLLPQPPEYRGDRHAAPHLAVIYWFLEQAKFWNSVLFHEKFTLGLLLQSFTEKGSSGRCTYISQKSNPSIHLIEANIGLSCPGLWRSPEQETHCHHHLTEAIFMLSLRVHNIVIAMILLISLTVSETDGQAGHHSLSFFW